MGGAEVDAYLASQPAVRSEPLQRIRALIHRVWPAVAEDMSYGMPTFLLDGHPLCTIANQKHFMAFYVVPYALLDAFNQELKGRDHGRSCIRFRAVDDEALDLIERIVRYTGVRRAESRLQMPANGLQKKSRAQRESL
jgi:uncharacterized protein YdhG (YjbR/CyaY superfamily)